METGSSELDIGKEGLGEGSVVMMAALSCYVGHGEDVVSQGWLDGVECSLA